MSAVTIAVLGGLGAMIGWGVADFFAKLCIDEVGELPSLAWGHLVGTILLGVVALGRLFGASHIAYGRIDAGVVALLALFGGLQALVYFLLYRGFAVGQIAVLSPVFASFSGVVAFVSIVFLGEHPGGDKLLALAAMFAGIVLLSTAESDGQRVRFFGAPGFAVVLAATLFAAGWTLGWDRLVHNRDPISFAFLMYAFMTVALFVAAIQQKAPLRSIGRRARPKLFVIGMGEALAYCSLTWGYSETKLVGVVALISGAFSLPTIALSRVFLGDRLGRLQISGVVGVLAGVGLLCSVR